MAQSAGASDGMPGEEDHWEVPYRAMQINLVRVARASWHDSHLWLIFGELAS